MQLIENASKNKLRGGYYTPRSIADFILRWGMRDNLYSDILEPSCGDGVFLDALRASERHFNSLTAVEYDKAEAQKARAIGIGDVVTGDFHLFCMNTTRRFNLIVGNPPFIRYQYYNEQQQQLAAEIFQRANLKFSKLTNAWVTFIIGSSLLLQDRGRIGFVVPAELLQVGYALQLRDFLSNFYNKIIILSFKKLVFESIQQEVVILLCEKDGSQDHLIDHIELEDDKDLGNLNVFHLSGQPKKIDFKSNKWTFYFLSQDEIDFIEEVNRHAIPTISKYADIEVGITTGSNGYFTVPASVVRAYQMEKYAYPMVGRSVQVSSCIFTKSDWADNQNKNAKSNLLIFPPNAREEANEGVRNYIWNGEVLGVDQGYKTSIRDYWYVIPSIKISDALFVRRNNLYPKLVLNEAKAYTTDTMHRVFIHESVNRQAFVASYYNSLSLAFAEILGRSYGGGVLELMPGEATKIPLPYKAENAEILDRIDSMLRDGDDIEDILDCTDEIVLKQGYKFTDQQVKLARSIWKKLSGRRLERGRSDVKPQKQTTKYEILVGQEGYQYSLFEPSALYQYKKDNTLLIASCRQGTKKWITTHFLYNYPISKQELEEKPELLNVKHIIIFNRKTIVGYYGVTDAKLIDENWLKDNNYPVKNSKRKADATYLQYTLENAEMEPPCIAAKDCKQILGKGIVTK